MRYIKYYLRNGCAEDDKEDVLVFPNKVTNSYIENYIFELLQSHADKNINVLVGWNCNYGWESEEDRKNYYDNVNFYWKEITKKEYKKWQEVN